MGLNDRLKKAFGLGKKEDSEVLESKPKNFKYLDDLIHSGAKQIVLDSDIILDDDEDSEYIEGIKIDVSDLTIDGRGHSIDACGKTRIFHNTCENVIIKEITLKNGANNEGGAILNGESTALTLINCELNSNIAKNGGGLVNKGQLKCKSTIFSFNVTLDYESTGSYQIDGGGAIENSHDGICELIDCKFESNLSPMGGGILNLGEVDCENTVFSNNSSKEAGGAIRNLGKLNCRNTLFINNCVDAGDGGAVENQIYCISEFYGCKFEDNKSHRDGGAIMNFGKVLCRNTEFCDNFADVYGGAVNNQQQRICEFVNCRFSANAAREGGGGVFNWGEINCKNSEFSNNSTISEGGAVNNYEGSCDFIDCTFISNSAEGNGGGITNLSRITCKNSIFSHNSTSGSGGAVINREAVLEFLECKFNDNIAYKGGGAIDNWGEINCKNSAFFNNSTSSSGGAIVNELGSVLNCLTSEFKNNISKENGSCVFNNSDEVRFSDCIFSNHTSGGNVIFNSYDMIFMDCIFKENAGIDCVLLSDGDSRVKLNGGKVLGNEVEYTAVHNQGKDFCITDTIFNGNKSSTHKHEGFDVVNDSRLTLISPKICNDNGILNNNHIEVKEISRSEVERIIKNGENANVNNIEPSAEHESDSPHQNNTKENLTDLDEEISLDNKEAEFETEELDFNETANSSDNDEKDYVGLAPLTGAVKIEEFSYLDDLIHSGMKEIVLDADIVLDAERETEYGDGIKLDVDDLVIDGRGHSIDATGKARIFECDAANVTIKNIILKNGFHAYAGALLNGESTNLNIINCEFRDNFAPEAGGGMLNFGKVKCSHTSFYTNSTSGSGGAVNIQEGRCDFIDCTFLGNSADDDGGAIDNWAELNCSDSQFYNNSTKSNGGSIINQRDCITNVTDCKFILNTAKEGGGAMVNWGKVNCRKSIFSQNRGDTQGGGAVNNQDGICCFTDCKFKDNLAEKGGGGAIVNWNEINCKDCLFCDNLARIGYGGAIYNQKDCGGNFIDCKFTANSSEEGGAIVNFGEINCKSSLFSNNSTKGNGGAVYNQKSSCEFADCKFSDNSAEISGGTMVNLGKLICTNSIFSNNSTKGSGGVINNQKDGFCKFVDCGFSYNCAEQSGGGIVNWGEINCKSSLFSNNSSKGMGGALNNQESICKFIDCEFDSNLAESGGGIINYGEVNCENSSFHNNRTNNDGGAINTSIGSILNCSDCEFENNASEGNGAGIYNNSNDIKLIKCIFSKHSAGNNVIFNASNLIFIHSIFKENSNVESILFNGSDSKLDFIGGKIMENNVRKSAVHNQGAYLAMSDTLFKDNVSSIYRYEGFDIVNDSELALKSPKISDDKGILNNNHIEIKKISQIEAERIIENSRNAYVDNFEPPIEYKFDFSHLNNLIQGQRDNIIELKEDITLENYEIDFFEGGIDIDNDNITIEGNNHIIDAKNRIRIFNILGNNIKLKNITFKNGFLSNNFNEHVTGGGAIKIIRDIDVTLENCRFINNHSEDDGGAIENNGILRCINNIFIGNFSRYYGGSIYNNNELHISNDVYEDNESKIAGAVYNNSRLFIQERISLKNNSCELSKDIYNADYMETQNINDPESFTYNTHRINEEAEYETKTFNGLWEELKKPAGFLLDNDIKLQYDGMHEDVIDVEEDIIFDGNNHIIDFNHLNCVFKIRKCAIFKNITFKNVSVSENPLFENNGNLQFENVKFINCRTSSNAHLIINNVNLNITDSSFCNNSGKNKSLIYNKSVMGIDNTVFENNNAQSTGTVIYNEITAKVSIRSSCFLCNYTKSDGGAICIMDHSALEVFDSQFIKNKSHNNGGVLFNKGDLYLEESVFKSNNAYRGGAIINFGKIVSANTKFSSNFANKYGGAIYNSTDGKISLSSTIFKNNSAEHGGAITAGGMDELDVKPDCKFIDNKPSSLNIFD